MLRIVGESAFQRPGAVDWNARSPSEGRDRLILGDTSNTDSLDLKRVPRLPCNGDQVT